MTRVTVKGLLRGPDSENMVLVLETAGGDRVLGLVVPMSEATRLGRVLGRGACRCSPIYDLLTALAVSAHVEVGRAVLESTEGGIGAELVFVGDGPERRFECHPADAVGLAIRSGAPIFITRAALAQACPTETLREPDPGATAWLERVRPSDFGPSPTPPPAS